MRFLKANNKKNIGLLRSSLVAVTVAATVATVAPAGADVFHGHWIGGKIEETYHRLGGWTTFGDAITPERTAAWNGRYQEFARDSSIYWHPNADAGTAHQVGGRIRDKWSDLGWENGTLGYPITDESRTPDGQGSYNHFQGGSIYWSPATDAHQIWGGIRDKWAEQGWENGPLGYPTTDERTTPDGQGKYNHFQGGSIYFSPATGVHSISGEIRGLWQDNGWEAGGFGYPTTDAYAAGGGTKQDFTGGSIQAFEPTGTVLRQFDNKRNSSYRQVFPLFTVDEDSRWHTAGLHRELAQNMGDYFPLQGCPDELIEGAVCTLAGVGGRTGTVTVDRIADDGFTLITAEDHPEGEGRVLNIRFDEVTAPDTADDEVIFDDPSLESQYTGSNKTWLRLVVEAFGPTADTTVAGPFSSDHVGVQVWSQLAGSVRETVDHSTTTYVPLNN